MNRDDYGVSDAVRNSPLAALLSADDADLPKPTTHLRVRGDVAFCGGSALHLSSTAGDITCERCKVEAVKREQRSANREVRDLLRRLAKEPAHYYTVTATTRERAIAAGLVRVVGGAAVVITDAGRARLAGASR